MTAYFYNGFTRADDVVRIGKRIPGTSNRRDTDNTVGCPVCFVEYEAEPVRCEACGYRFGGRR